MAGSRRHVTRGNTSEDTDSQEAQIGMAEARTEQMVTEITERVMGRIEMMIAQLIPQAAPQPQMQEQIPRQQPMPAPEILVAPQPHMEEQIPRQQPIPAPEILDHQEEPDELEDNKHRKLLLNLKRLEPTQFYGTTDSLTADHWFQEIEGHLDVLRVTGPSRVALATHQFKGAATSWWHLRKTDPTTNVKEMNWGEFKEIFYAKFFPEATLTKMQEDFVKLNQKDMTVAEYEAKFTELAKFLPDLIRGEKMKVHRFTQGLRIEIRKLITSANPKTYIELVDRALAIEQDLNFEQRLRNNNKRPGDNRDYQGDQKRRNNNQNNGNNIHQTQNRSKQAWEEHIELARRQGLCFYCNQHGHMARSCPNKTQNHQQQRPRNHQGGGQYIRPQQQPPRQNNYQGQIQNQGHVQIQNQGHVQNHNQGRMQIQN